MTEAEKRLHRCCFCGPDMEGLDVFDNEIQAWLKVQVRRAVADGYRTFLIGMRQGTDITAGGLVREIKEKDPSVRLICVEPWAGMAAEWNYIWAGPHDYLMKVAADHVKVLSEEYHKDVYREADEYMVDHCARLIAYYDEKSEDVWEMMAYAVRSGLEVVSNRQDLVRDYREALARPGKYGLPER